ncbi:MAG: hypothetical protein DWQ06_12805 [Calditrichaeota bacterium]|nr:MAG: hypothetical protein DWQ06_12805 [Calditrichota bacterium]
MLDFTQVVKELDKTIFENKKLYSVMKDRFKIALENFSELDSNWEEFQRRLKEDLNERNSFWHIPISKLKISEKFPLPNSIENYTVVAVDGSQIYPDSHEVTPCYLINLGIICLTYGENSNAEMNSEALLFAKEDEIFPRINGRKVQVNSALVDFNRDILEREKLSEICLSKLENTNLFGLIDGTLIPWVLGTEIPGRFTPDDLKEDNLKRDILERYSKVYAELYEAKIPFASYISSSRSNEVTNFLRLNLCDQNQIDCKNCKPRLEKKEITCEKINGISDSELLGEILEEGERTQVFLSTSEALNAKIEGEELFPFHLKIGFFYLKVQNEVARIEIPIWLTDFPEKLDFIHSQIYLQSQKGLGFPISIAEAHNFAVVSNRERETFYRLFENSFTKEKFSVKLSNKQLNKRIKVT